MRQYDIDHIDKSGMISDFEWFVITGAKFVVVGWFLMAIVFHIIGG